MTERHNSLPKTLQEYIDATRALQRNIGLHRFWVISPPYNRLVLRVTYAYIPDIIITETVFLKKQNDPLLQVKECRSIPYSYRDSLGLLIGCHHMRNGIAVHTIEVKRNSPIAH